MASPTTPELHVVVIAGGRGTRFWPLSRRRRPKQVLALTGDRSLIRQTVDRLRPLAPAERTWVVTGPDMVDAIRAELTDLPAANILVEPSGRNTAPCIGWATVEILRRAGRDAVVAVLPADHLIQRPGQLRQALQAAVGAAVQTHSIVTLGITPTRPETGFGYLELGEDVGRWSELPVRRVASFREKPDQTTARQYLDSGRYLWNAGMFVFAAATMLDAFRQHLPRSAAALDTIATQPDALAEQWAQLDATSIDYGIMERFERVLTVPCAPGWSDVGAWPAAAEHMEPLPGGVGKAARVIAVNSADNVLHAPDKLVALVGVQGLVVVDSGDALLVMARDRAQELRQVLAELEAQGLDEYT